MYFVIAETVDRTRNAHGPGDPIAAVRRVERLVVGQADTEAAAEEIANNYSRQGTTHYIAKALLKVVVSPRTEKL